MCGALFCDVGPMTSRSGVPPAEGARKWICLSRGGYGSGKSKRTVAAVAGANVWLALGNHGVIKVIVVEPSVLDRGYNYVK